MPRETADVQLVDDRLDEWAPERLIAFPVVAVGSATTLFMAVGAVVTRAACGFAVVRIGHGDGKAVWIEQHFSRVEPQPRSGAKGPCAR